MTSNNDIAAHVSNFLVVPFTISHPFLQPTTQWVYLQPHKPQRPDPDSARSLFLVNIPPEATDIHFRSLFTKLGGGRVEHVTFEEIKWQRKGRFDPRRLRGAKRKKANAVTDDAELEFTEASEPTLHRSGSSVIVVFVDRASMELSYKAAVRAIKHGTKIDWAKDVEAASISKMGTERYLRIHRDMFPNPQNLNARIDAYMTSFANAESTRVRALARQRQIPDEDGFITVTRGGRDGPARNKEAQEKLEKQKKKAEEKKNGLQDFYRFQLRERRKNEAGLLKRKFQNDRKRVDEMREAKRSRFTPF